MSNLYTMDTEEPKDRTYSAHEQSWKDRLIKDLLHDHRENLRAEDVRHRETDSDSFQNALEKPSTLRQHAHIPSIALLIPISFSVS